MRQNSRVSVAAVGWRTQLGSVCLGKQQSRGLWETAIRVSAVPPVKQVDVRTACFGWPPPHQSHFPKVAVTHGAPSPTVYVTVPVKGIMAWHSDISVWGRGGESSRVRVGLNLFLRI